MKATNNYTDVLCEPSRFLWRSWASRALCWVAFDARVEPSICRYLSWFPSDAFHIASIELRIDLSKESCFQYIMHCTLTSISMSFTDSSLSHISWTRVIRKTLPSFGTSPIYWCCRINSNLGSESAEIEWNKYRNIGVISIWLWTCKTRCVSNQRSSHK